MSTRRILDTLHDAAIGTPSRDPDTLAADIYLEHVHRQDVLRHIRVAVMGTWFLAAVISVCAFLSGCTRAAPVAPHTVMMTPAKAYDRAVRIERVCFTGDAFAKVPDIMVDGGFGSGVVLETGVVLTAYHVIKCLPHSVALIHVVGPDEIKLWATVAAVDAAHDIVRLSVPGVTGDRIELATPMPGEAVCVASAFPERGFACGLVWATGPMQTRSNGEVNIWHTARTIPGNSGAGLYNRRGQLVGLATNGYKPEAHGTGGLATSLIGRVP